ncbi:hypothetical protein D9611_006089 [Ephemerocybe angulata]|uniref:Uncharacterized protein n=1 Tax=Ephemerocybe angulata TaxID=980116 RepID=A0A8H5FLN1_9AGAR|nr:hypothetical protein D9611_006089 [Tulosesus angulatus]
MSYLCRPAMDYLQFNFHKAIRPVPTATPTIPLANAIGASIRFDFAIVPTHPTSTTYRAIPVVPLLSHPGLCLTQLYLRVSS